jgi:hypothetical protein
LKQFFVQGLAAPLKGLAKKEEKFVLIFAEIVVDTLVPLAPLTLIILFSKI